MANLALARRRLQQQGLAGPGFATAAEAVAWLGALQAQEHLAARWAVGLRCAGLDEAAMARALDTGQVVRTWAMRGTFQLVAPADLRWLLAVVGPPALARHGPAFRKLGVDEAAYAACEPVLVEALRGRALTRPALFAALEQGGIHTAGQRGYYYLVSAALRSKLCLGPMQGKQETYVLVDEWVPPAPALLREQGLAELARRYVTSRGPATLTDFAHWSGLTRTEARAALEAARGSFAEAVVDGEIYYAPPETPEAEPAEAYLLPAFDEYLIGYYDRSAVLAPRHSPRVLSYNGIFYPTLVCGGLVVGTWKRAFKRSTVEIMLSPFGRLSRAQRQALGEAAERFAAFVGLTPQVTIKADT